MSGDKKESNVFYITHSGELLIWLIIILIVVACSSLSFITKEKNNDNDYKIFLQDVDGLIVGSPVRMMGVEVGYVTKIKPIQNDVYVKFILTNPDTYIPQGTQATVEFSGMAGSKSLELYLPDKNTYIDNSVPMITVNSPKRLNDALWLFGDMYKKIGSIINSCSSFGGKLDLDINEDKSNHPNINLQDFIQYSNKYIDETSQKEKELMQNIKGINKHDRKIR